MSVADAIDLTIPLPNSSETDQLKLSPASKSKKKKASVLPTFLPPCRVCNATASGYHYGANTCEACKAFFRRSIGHEDAIKPCQSDGQCAENPSGKITCSDCRHKKCLSIGMAKEGCRKGRYTYEKRTQDTKEIRRMQAEVNISKHFEIEQCAEMVSMLVSHFAINFPNLANFVEDKISLLQRVNKLMNDNGLMRGTPLQRVHYSPGANPNPQAEGWLNDVNQQLAKVYAMVDQNDVSSLECAGNMVFNAWAFQAEQTLHALTAYVKGLPGFSDLLLDDRIILLKQGRVDTMNILKHKFLLVDMEAVIHYEADTDDVFLMPINAVGRFIGRDFADFMLCIGSRIQKLRLAVEDMAVLLALVVLMSDREGLQRTDQVERLQDKILPLVQYCLQKNHPDQPNIMAETLLVLPMLRESAEIQKRCFCKVRDKINPEATPLLAEIMQ